MSVFVYFLCFCRELREKIQPEIMELIKQQRLNRLCEGTCFRKISSRRRQGEPHSTHTQTHTHTYSHAYSIYTDHNHTDFVHKGNSSVSSPISVCVFVLYPSSLLPHSSPYSLCVMKTSQEIWYHRRSLKLWTAVELLSWWFTHIFLALSDFEADTYSNTTPLLLKHK